MTGFSGTTNKSFSVGRLYTDDLEVGDKLTVTFSASYSGLTSASGQTAVLVLQGSGNTTSWSPGVNAGTKVSWTGTGSATYTGTITLTESQLTNDYFSLNIRTDYYSAGTITVTNLKIKRTTTETVSKPYGTRLGTLPSPSETGYTLNGWYTATSGGTKISTTTTVTANKTYYAQWSAKTYTVTYNYSTNGGTSATKTTATVASDELIDLTPTATKSGYTFVGWNTSSTATTKLGYLPMRTSDVTLYAIFSKKITATCYYYNNQKTEVSKTIYNTTSSASLTLPSITNQTVNSVTYTARGWSTSNTANATVNSGASVTLSSNKTYYASYSASIKATFYYCTLAKTAYTYSNAAQSSTTATATRYMSYTGGFVQSNYTVPSAVTSSSGGASAENYVGVATAKSSATTVTPTTANTTFYAVYTESLTFYYYNGSSHTSTTRTRRMLSNGSTYSNSLNSAAPTPSAFNGAFLAWSYDSAKYGTSYRREPLATGTNNLYAIYSKSITATFNYYSGSAATSTTASANRYYVSKSGGINTYNTNYTIPTAASSNRTISGVTYTYRGVSTSPTSQAVLITPTTANTTYYTSYSTTLTATFDGNGATAGPPEGIPSISGTSYADYKGSRTGVLITMPEINCTKTSGTNSWSYDGWNTKADRSGTNYQEGVSVRIYNDTTYYIEWVPNNYKNLKTNVYYEKLNDALSEVETVNEYSEPIAISVLRNVTETSNITVPEDKRVTLIMNSHTITLSNVSITSNATWFGIGVKYSSTDLTSTQKIGTITYTGTGDAIQCNNGSTQIRGTTINSNGNGIRANKGNVNVQENSQIVAEQSGIFMENNSYATIKNSQVTGDYGIFLNGSGSLNVEQNSTIIGTKYHGIVIWPNSNGIVNFGSNSDSFSISNPTARGADSGIVNNGGTLNFLNGRALGVINAVYNVTSTRTGYQIYNSSSTTTINGVVYNRAYLTASTSTSSLSLSTSSFTKSTSIIPKTSQNTITDNISEYNQSSTTNETSDGGNDDPPSDENATNNDIKENNTTAENILEQEQNNNNLYTETKDEENTEE